MKAHLFTITAFLLAFLALGTGTAAAPVGHASRCEPVWFDTNLHPHVDPRCIGPANPSAAAMCEPVWIDMQNHVHVDTSCIGPSTAARCDPVYWSPGTPPQPHVDPRCIGPPVGA